ncbi:MAG: hypothetical protein EGR13_01280 [Coprococcus comes]|nr:hypothetical protein [Coprococcus comes]
MVKGNEDIHMENSKNIRLPWPEWEIVKYLGGGAYGKVYEIERNNSGIREKAAVKIVSRPKEESELEADYQNGYDRESIAVKYTEILQEYINEYKLMKELQGQSNIVSCDDFALEKNPNGIGGKIYIRMELLTPLQKVTKERLLSEKEVIKLGKDICKALILCESKNIIHRDIKPDNIMISKFDDYKLGDFGVSKVMSHTTGATMTGTEGYMAPEVLHIEKYGKEVDIYSLGIVMYWLLNNRRMPFIGADEKVTLVNANQAAIRRYQGEKIPAPKNGSDELKKIVLKACEYKPKDRYLTAQEMYDALEEIGSGKSYTKNTVSGYQAETSSGDEWMESGETAGETEGGFSGGQTEGNSWGGGGTIGKLKGNTEKKQKEVQEEPKTIGVKKAYQEQKDEKSPSQSRIGVRNSGGKYQEEKKTANDNDLHMNVRISQIEVGQKTTVHVNYPDGRKKAFEVKVPENISNGTIIRLKGQGKTSEGDLLLHIAIKAGAEKIPDFVKDEDLYKTIQIKESEIGTNVELLVNYPDGQKKKLGVHIPENASDGTILRLKGLGKTKDGNLLLHLAISKNDENMPETVEKKSFFGKIKDLFK